MPVVLLTCVYLIRETLLSVYSVCYVHHETIALFVIKGDSWWRGKQLRFKILMKLEIRFDTHHYILHGAVRQLGRLDNIGISFIFLYSERCELHKTLFNLESCVRDIRFSLKGRAMFFLRAGNKNFHTKQK